MRFGSRNIMMFGLLSVLFATLLAACGGGGGGTPTTTPTPAVSKTVSGIATTGVVMAGTVHLLDSSGTSRELSQPINADG